MSSLLSVLNIARSGLTSSSAGLGVTGENITGANTAGFVRRSARLEARPLRQSVAAGVNFTGVDRAFDRFSYRNILREAANFGSADARSESLTYVEGVIAPGDEYGLDNSIAEFFAAFDDLAANAADPTARAAVIAASREVADGFNAASAGLFDSRNELLAQAQSVAGEINVRLGKIGELNTQIKASASQDTSGKAELIDQRDQLVREVAQRIGATAIPDDDDGVTLLSSGSTLFDGEVTTDVQVSVDANGDLQIDFARNGNVLNVTNKVTSGELGGLREARDTDIPELLTDLDQMAFDFATAVNTLHAAGADNNVPPGSGLNLFADALNVPPPLAGAAAAMQINPVIAADSNLIAAALNPNSPPPGGNATAILISQLQNQSIGSNGTPAETFGALSGKIGNKLHSAEGELRMRESTVAHADNLRDSISGVSLDEEMINLTKFQRAFEASMRVLQTADELITHLVRSL